MLFTDNDEATESFSPYYNMYTRRCLSDGYKGEYVVA